MVETHIYVPVSFSTNTLEYIYPSLTATRYAYLVAGILYLSLSPFTLRFCWRRKTNKDTINHNVIPAGFFFWLFGLICAIDYMILAIFVLSNQKVDEVVVYLSSAATILWSFSLLFTYRIWIRNVRDAVSSSAKSPKTPLFILTNNICALIFMVVRSVFSIRQYYVGVDFYMPSMALTCFLMVLYTTTVSRDYRAVTAPRARYVILALYALFFVNRFAFALLNMLQDNMPPWILFALLIVFVFGSGVATLVLLVLYDITRFGTENEGLPSSYGKLHDYLYKPPKY